MENKEIVVTLLTAVQVLHETIDSLEGTPYYKRKLKNATVRFEKVLTEECDREIARLWAIDEDTMMILQDGITEVAKEMAGMNPSEIGRLGQLFKDDKLTFIHE